MIFGGFGNIETTFDEYTGLIYDGAFSEHMISFERKGLTGEDVDENGAKEIAKKFMDVSDDRIESKGYSENGNIPAYNFDIKMENNGVKNVSISKKGGHIVNINYYREIKEEKISPEQAIEIGKNFLSDKGYNNMKETYYMMQSGNVVINYAYSQDDVTIYSDLIKLKVALDNGEILGLESIGYLNCHSEREISKDIVSKEKAKENLNDRIEVNSEGLAIIPTEYNTEVLCWEFKGKYGDNDFLVYINAETRRGGKYFDDC